MIDKSILLKLFTGIIACCMISLSAKAQEKEAPSPFKISADLVSSYVWRGVLSTATPTPNIQPTISFSKGGLELGAWGSSDFNGSYKEVDFYVSYTIKQLKFTVTDYDWNFKNRYFNYKNKETDHIFEGSVAYSGPESFPLSIAANVMFAGADKKYDQTLNAINPAKQAYSTYFEFGYSFKNITPFLGITPSDGYYGDGYGGVKGFGVVNLGASFSKTLKITNDYSLPVKATVGFNPQKEDVFLVFAITL